MRRAAPALIATVIGLIALASFKSSPGASNNSAAFHSVKPSSPVATAPPTPTTNPPSPATTSPGTTSPATTAPSSGNAARTVVGDPVDNRYGTVQVEVTLQGTQITAVTALQMPTDRQRSAEISQQADPLLQQEALQAQSAQIDILGGATYTSTSYAQSLQSALDKAGK